MAKFYEPELVVDHYYDKQRNRHYLNNQLSVVHCHHYTALYTQLAEDVDFLDARQLMANTAEDTFYKMLDDYYNKYKVSDLQQKILFAQEYYSVLGLGKMEVHSVGRVTGEVILHFSHVDSSWKQKWGQHDKPINHITRGYVSAMFSLFNNFSKGTYRVNEVASIVMGAEKSILNVIMI